MNLLTNDINGIKKSPKELYRNLNLIPNEYKLES